MIDLTGLMVSLGQIKILSFRLVTIITFSIIAVVTWYFDLPRIIQNLSSRQKRQPAT